MCANLSRQPAWLQLLGYIGPMRRAVRVGLVVLGAAMAVYGAVSLTGGWLGTPLWRPWVFGPPPRPTGFCVVWDTSARDRRMILAGEFVQVAGLALVAVGAWPRRAAGTAS